MTLAEVLITLGIIGTIAAFTIPTLIANTQKQEYTTTLKKAYTTFNQALMQMTIDYGCPGDLRCTGLFANGALQSTGNIISSYFKVNKNCGTTSSQGCFSDSVGSYYNNSGARNTTFDSGSYRFITIDNIAFAIVSMNNNCSTSNYGVGSMASVCGILYLDVNGLKGPNNFGRDIFDYYITNGKGPLLYPYGGPDMIINGVSNYWKDLNSCNNLNPGGTPCAGRVMEESWQMNY